MCPTPSRSATIPPACGLNWLCAGLALNLLFLCAKAAHQRGVTIEFPLSGAYIVLLLLAVWRVRPQEGHVRLWTLWCLMIVAQLVVYNLLLIFALLKSPGTAFTFVKLFSLIGLICGWIPALMVYSVSVRGRLLLIIQVVGPVIVVVVPLAFWHLGWR